MCNLHWCYTFCTGVTLFALLLHLNCTALSQSESSNFFICIINKVIRKEITVKSNLVQLLQRWVVPLQNAVRVVHTILHEVIISKVKSKRTNAINPLQKFDWNQNLFVHITNHHNLKYLFITANRLTFPQTTVRFY